MTKYILSLVILTLYLSCSKSKESDNQNNTSLQLETIILDQSNSFSNKKGVSLKPVIQLIFESSIKQESAHNSIEMFENGNKVDLTFNFGSDFKKITIQPKNNLVAFTNYSFVIRKTLSDIDDNKIKKEESFQFTTGIDQKDKFERINLDDLLTKIQKQTFRYFWDFSHPSYGMIRERNTSKEIVTTGGTGFGIMAILIGIERGFINKNQGLEKIKNIITFLKKADKYHGAYSHWYDGSTAKTIAFSAKDNGADLVETSLLFQGLLTARSYFDDDQLSNDITTLYNNIEWSFFKNNQKTLFWHWSPNYSWEMNLPIKGWNEALITYILAAGSPTYSIQKEDYDNGWTQNGTFKNGKKFYGITLPLGPDFGGPLFLSQYSFLGLNPFNLHDEYVSYNEQVTNHSLINRAHCITNPNNFYGYSESCWGLTASDHIIGYEAHSPTNDKGVISPTAAISSIPYTPTESIQALEFFYYKLGDKIWGEYGFKDAFSLDQPWFAESYIAINQGPIIIGIENYRSGLLWKNFMQAPEIKTALNKLNITYTIK